MHQRYKDGDSDFKPNTRTHTSVIDAWAKSGEKGAAKRAEQILNNMISHYEAIGDSDVKPNVHTANAVCNVSYVLLATTFFLFFDTVWHLIMFLLCFNPSYYRPALSQRWTKIVQRQCRLLSVCLTGSHPNQI